MEVKKLTEEELENLKSINSQYREAIETLGNIQLQRLNLSKREDIIKGQIDEMQILEQTLSKTLSEKYGDGEINIQTGEITTR